MDKLLYQINVQGRVQGVWFRKYTLDKARSIGLTGFVKNNLDGAVYIEAEGDAEQLNEFINWLYRGSPLSRVTSVEYEKGSIENYDVFEVRS
jgi:acylphosphatase